MNNAIYVMWLREVKRFIRSKSRIVGSLGQPILFLVALGYGLGPVFQKAGQGNYLEFIAPGIIGMAIIFSAIFNGMQVIWDRQFGFLKETMVAPVSRLAIMFGRTIGGATVASAQGVLVLFIAVLAGFRVASWTGILPAVIIMLLIALLFSALGIMVASLLKDMQGFQLIMNFLIMPLFFLSGALFPLNSAPSALLLVARFDPLSYGVDALRYFLIGTSTFSLTLDVGVLLGVSALFLALGSYFFSIIEI
ncbi:MAG: multidrug ABC transporter permease [Parcubacteria group bacterium 20-58-5]|nr:MAG: multidrug ABC transporter permease [Parcubacteria group bacterium 20-58-5]OYV63192.1 MAG: multidrug ABC transporter permease [Parcubacteria group bacterium 21-58-10]HQT83056.1 ABC transporter permease [Candidatus Paceibacterota bacterium]